MNQSARRWAMWLTGFVAGLVMVALVVGWLNGVGQPPFEEVVPAPLPMEPIISAIDSPVCRDRAVGAQYAMVCVDSQLLNTDDRAACDRFGGPYQIIVCPDPSRIAMGDTRPTIVASVGNVVLPLPIPAGTVRTPDPAATPDLAGSATPTPANPGAEEPPPQEKVLFTPTDVSGEAQQPATPVPDLPQAPPGPAATPEPPSGAPPGSATLVPTPGDAVISTSAPTATPPQADPTPGVVTATATFSPVASSEVTPTPTPTVEASPTPTPVPVIILPNEGYVLTGAGPQTTPGLALTSTRLLLVRLTYAGAGGVAVSLRGANGSAGRLILQASSLPEKSGVIDIPNEGVYYIDVSTTSAGAWTLTVSQPVPPPQTPFTSPSSPLTGRGDQATSLVRLRNGAISIRFEHVATGNFTVTLYDAETGRPVGSPLVQTIGPVQQTVTVPIPREGIYIFDVTATDTWSITIQ